MLNDNPNKLGHLIVYFMFDQRAELREDGLIDLLTVLHKLGLDIEAEK